MRSISRIMGETQKSSLAVGQTFTGAACQSNVVWAADFSDIAGASGNVLHVALPPLVRLGALLSLSLTERKRQDTSAQCSEKRRRDGMLRTPGPNRPTLGAFATSCNTQEQNA